MKTKISVGTWVYGMGTDRYVGSGYKDPVKFEDRVRAVSKLEGVSGIEITYPCDVSEDNWDIIKPLLTECHLSIVSMGVELVCDREWKDGSLSALNPERRAKSVNLVKKAMDFAVEAGVKTVCLWLGQDVFDYVFQNDYVKAYQNLIDSIRECAQHKPQINLGIEYKVSEPKMSCMIKNAGMALAAAQATGCANVGITLDIGHAFNAGENPAEVASILFAQNRLFHIHVNDNYRIADDDMPVGTVHWPQYFELFYWMNRLGYDGWYSLDLYPYRDDPDEACRASIDFINGAMKYVEEKLPKDFVTGTEQKPGRILQSLYRSFFDGGAE